MKLPGIKRILPLILTVLLLPSLLAVPAWADMVSDNSYNVLDYCLPDGGDDYTAILTADDPRAEFDFNQAPDVVYVDILFSTDSVTFMDIFAGYMAPSGLGSLASQISYVNFWLNMESYGSDQAMSGYLYRVYGYVDVPDDYLGFYLELDGVDEECYVTFHSFEVSSVVFRPELLDCTATLVSGGNDPVDLEYTGSYTYMPWQVSDTDYSSQGNFDVSVEFADDWNKYDYIDLSLKFWVRSIDSVSVTCGNSVVPYEINTIVGSNVGVSPYTAVNLRIDTSGLDPAGDSPVVLVSGVSKNASSGTNFVGINFCSGAVATEPPSALVYWARQIVQTVSDGFGSVGDWIADQTSAINKQISTWAGNIIDAIRGTGDASQLQEDLNSAVGDLQQAGQVMDSVDRPDIGQVNIDVAGMVPATGFDGIGALVTVVYDNPVLQPIMLMTFTLALIAFVIFGLR